MDENWIVEMQAQLDRVDLKPDHQIDAPYLVVGCGSFANPLLQPVGADRYGRVWVQEGKKLRLLSLSV